MEAVSQADLVCDRSLPRRWRISPVGKESQLPNAAADQRKVDHRPSFSTRPENRRSNRDGHPKIVWLRPGLWIEEFADVPFRNARLPRLHSKSWHGKLRRHPTGLLDQRSSGWRTGACSGRLCRLQLQLPESVMDGSGGRPVSSTQPTTPHATLLTAYAQPSSESPICLRCEASRRDREFA